MFTQKPLMKEITRLQERGETGVLDLKKEGKRIILYFRDGLVDAAGTNIVQFQIGKFLCQKKRIGVPELLHLLESARRQRILLGRAAVSRKLITGSELREAVQQQVMDLLAYALEEEFEIGSFTRSACSLYMPAGLDQQLLLLEMARKSCKPFKLKSSELVTLKNGHKLPDLIWYPQELSVLAGLGRPSNLSDLSDATGLDPAKVGRILSVLDALELIAVVEETSGSATALVRRSSFPFEYLTPEIDGSGLHGKIKVLQDPMSFVSEQFKALKIRIRELSSDRSIRVITVSSAHPEDGKSLISANLAASCSMDPSRRVILVDCDLRNPSVHEFLGTSCEPGLIGYLENDGLMPYCYMRRCGRLYVMTAGGSTSKSVELLMLEKMQRLIEYLKIEFDTVILDVPPIAPISDARIVASISDGILLVVRSGRTSYRGLDTAMKVIDRNKLLGLVLNDVRPLAFNTLYKSKYYNYKNRYLYSYPKRADGPRTKSYLD